MAYKDKEKQKEAARIRQQRRRDAIKAKGVTKPERDDGGVTEKSEQTPEEYRIRAEGTFAGSTIGDKCLDEALHNLEDAMRPLPTVLPKAEALKYYDERDEMSVRGAASKPRANDPPFKAFIPRVIEVVNVLPGPDSAVQAIWDGRNAQGQAGGYSSDAEPEDYPQIQRPHHAASSTPEPVRPEYVSSMVANMMAEPVDRPTRPQGSQ